MNIQFDLIEVILKQNLNIPLTDSELQWLDTIDDTTKNTVCDLIHDSSYYDEVLKLLDCLMKRAENLPYEEQIDIKNKCMSKKKELKLCLLSKNKPTNVTI